MIVNGPPFVARRRLLAMCGTLAAGFGTSSVAKVFASRAAAGPVTEQGYAGGDGVRIFYVRAGDGPLMLFLHGVADDWSLYEAQIKEFCRDHLVVAPNLRGFPPSDTPDAVQAYAMPRLLSDVHGLLDHFGRERCILVGNDWGGYIAWVFASAYPARVERLIILNAPHPAIHLREVRTNAAQIEASQYERDYNAATAPYPSWYNYYRADPIKTPASTTEAASMAVPDLAAHFFSAVARPPAKTSLRIDMPTLVIWGMHDPYILPGELDGLKAFAPASTVVRLEDAGHYPMRSHPGPVNQAIRAFIERSN